LSKANLLRMCHCLVGLNCIKFVHFLTIYNMARVVISQVCVSVSKMSLVYQYQ